MFLVVLVLGLILGYTWSSGWSQISLPEMATRGIKSYWEIVRVACEDAIRGFQWSKWGIWQVPDFSSGIVKVVSSHPFSALFFESLSPHRHLYFQIFSLKKLINPLQLCLPSISGSKNTWAPTARLPRQATLGRTSPTPWYRYQNECQGRNHWRHTRMGLWRLRGHYYPTD